MLIHATAIAREGRAVLLTGPSGCGKSDLALRAMAQGWALITDDLVKLAEGSDRLVAARHDDGPARLAVRGIGIITPDQTVDTAPLALSVRLDPQAMPQGLEPRLAKAGPWHRLFVPEVTLHPFEASVVTKLTLALDRFGH